MSNRETPGMWTLIIVLGMAVFVPLALMVGGVVVGFVTHAKPKRHFEVVRYVTVESSSARPALSAPSAPTPQAASVAPSAHATRANP